ncbi:pilus assembly protein [Photorhabdus luminescens]|nr:pilus assembly protein [Photorhabdus luminescens]
MKENIQVNDAVLLLCEEQQATVLIDNNRRGDPQVQTRVMQLLEAMPEAEIHFVNLSELQANRQKQNQRTNEQGVCLSDLTDVSERQKQVLTCFELAKKLNASDIHLTISPGLTRIEMRIHGELKVVNELSEEEGMALASTIILSMCDVTETQFFPGRQQDGRIKADFLRRVHLYGARYSHTPTADGLYVVMRVIADDGDKVPTLTQLGFLPQQIKLISRILRLPEGMIVLSGPTGSGKSTTLRTFCRQYLDRTGGKKRLLTVEDPPEGRIAGAIQTPIVCDKSDEEAVRLAWHRALTSALRLDPDAVMPGEMRDLTSMLTAIYAAQTGHSVMTTLHTNSAVGIPERMITMGVNAGLIANAQLLIALISQRLVQTLCPHCRVPWAQKQAVLDEEQRAYLMRYCHAPGTCCVENLYFRHPEGCEHCCQTITLSGRIVSRGVTGRSVVAEVIRPDARFFTLLMTEGKEAARQHWVSNLGGITRRQHLLHKLNAGLIDPLEADLVCPLDEDDYLLMEPCDA